MLLGGGLGSTGDVAPNVGMMPTHATAQPAAEGGHGTPSHDGQGCVHSPRTLVPCAAGDPADANVDRATAGSAVAKAARQLKTTARMRRRFIAVANVPQEHAPTNHKAVTIQSDAQHLAGFPLIH